MGAGCAAVMGQRRCARTRLTDPGRPPPGTLIEDKGSVALHSPGTEAEAAEIEARAIEAKARAIASPAGKMVVELVPAGFDKGRPWHG